MFDIGFSEIMVIMLVALVVIGPERLPKVARTLGQLWGRVQRYVNSVKRDIGSSVELEELREVERQVKAEAEALERSVQQAGHDIERDLGQLERELEQPVQTIKQAAVPDLPNKA
ncbi:Sec-independent protein translocase protein TatB [Ferrigenium sp. UT5]|uniref:Sec-independent protein translocase protein TatB n=1 Tax=Ferrigenium sp. UT5 TaxID=3242105 RepID=UPI003552506F